MLGIIAAIFAYFLFALGNIFEKILRSNHLKSPLTIILLEGIAILPFLLIPFFYNVNTTDYWNIALSMLAGALSIAGFLSYLVALKKEEASKLVSLWNISPLITLILAFFILQEKLPPNFYLAFALIFLGGILISRKDLRGVSSHGFYLMMLSNLLYSIAVVITKFVFNNMGFLDFIFYSGVCNTIISFSVLIPKNIRPTLINDIRKIENRDILIGYLVVIPIAWILYWFSVNQLPVSIVLVFGGMQSAFVFILALFLSFKFPKILKEDINKEAIAIKIVSILLMLIGLYILGTK